MSQVQFRLCFVLVYNGYKQECHHYPLIVFHTELQCCIFPKTSLHTAISLKPIYNSSRYVVQKHIELLTLKNRLQHLAHIRNPNPVSRCKAQHLLYHLIEDGFLGNFCRQGRGLPGNPHPDAKWFTPSIHSFSCNKP
jgi:hypothetical protein